jgi:hypothetical protein
MSVLTPPPQPLSALCRKDDHEPWSRAVTGASGKDHDE